MKHIIAILIVAVVLFIAVAVSKTEACDQNNPCSNGNPEQVVSAWGFTNGQLPTGKAGEWMTLANGTRYLCPAWFGNIRCVDISGTDYYKARWGGR